MSVRLCVYACMFIFSSLERNTAEAQIVYSRWYLHNEYTMSLIPLPVWMPASNIPTVLSLHAYHCCCHSRSCLSLAFCVLELLIYSSFLPGTLHLIWDERTGAGDKMFPYHGYIKLNLFVFNVCAKMRCLLALLAFISTSAEIKMKKKYSVHPELQGLWWQ